jgi:tetratricopeptide (TPR) repeat protein
LVQAQERTDRVEYYDRAKNSQRTSRTGTITREDPARLVIRTGLSQKVDLDIAAGDIIDVTYDGEPAETREARVAERSKDFDRALRLYQEAAKKAPPGNKHLQAHLRFKVAKLLVRNVEAGQHAARLPATETLQRFQRDFPDSRHIIECLDLLSRLLLMEGKSTQEVVEAFGLLKRKYAEHPEITSRCDLFTSQLQLQEAQNLLKDQPELARQKYAAAEKFLRTMLPNADKRTGLDIRIRLAECQTVLGQKEKALQDLDAILQEAADDRTRAAAHLGRGSCYRLNRQWREAMWEYLWVDVVYYQDTEQHAEALYYLHQVFEAQGDAERAKQCRERLQNEQRLKDTRYQKLLAAR